MKAYRYNAKNRTDRKFNDCGSEKNLNNIKFYATNRDYVEKYKFIYNEDGELLYECELEIIDLENNNLFDMNSDFQKLNSYKNYIEKEIGQQLKDYTKFMNESSEESEREMWKNQINDLHNREQELISFLVNCEFQPLSDFQNQNELVNELKNMGFEGYKTKNEIAIF